MTITVPGEAFAPTTLNQILLEELIAGKAVLKSIKSLQRGMAEKYTSCESLRASLVMPFGDVVTSISTEDIRDFLGEV